MTTAVKTDFHTMPLPRLERVLVVVSPDLLNPSAPASSPLISRALQVARSTGCEVELFHGCHDGEPRLAFFQDPDAVEAKRQRMLQHEATVMAEVAVRLNAEGVRIRHDTRWDAPRADAVLRKIDEAQPDLVLKQTRRHSYVLGMMDHTDWSLIRRSPAHVWFAVEGATGPLRRMITAIGQADGTGQVCADDYVVAGFASFLAEELDMVNQPVHACEAGVSADHHRQLNALAQLSHFDSERVRLLRGAPYEALSDFASETHTDLMVLPARSLDRWERVLREVTAEPLLEHTPCDVLFVKRHGDERVPRGNRPQRQGQPVIRLEQAEMDPGRVFASPEDLAGSTELSRDVRLRLLSNWESDLLGQIQQDDEGRPMGGARTELLPRVRAARARLECTNIQNVNQ